MYFGILKNSGGVLVKKLCDSFLFYYIFINLFIKIINLINDDCVLVKKTKKNTPALIKSGAFW